jgi:hypothetical protein
LIACRFLSLVTTAAAVEAEVLGKKKTTDAVLLIND